MVIFSVVVFLSALLSGMGDLHYVVLAILIWAWGVGYGLGRVVTRWRVRRPS